MVDDEPCKVLSMTKSKPGKHGAAKARVEVVGLFDNRKRVIMRPASATAVVPIIDKKKAQVISVSGDIAQLMDMEEYTTFEAKIPDEMKAKIQPGNEISYWKVNERVLLRE
jgi:translation initiation factor 5A